MNAPISTRLAELDLARLRAKLAGTEQSALDAVLAMRRAEARQTLAEAETRRAQAEITQLRNLVDDLQLENEALRREPKRRGLRAVPA